MTVPRGNSTEGQYGFEIQTIDMHCYGYAGKDWDLDPSEFVLLL